MFSAQYIIVEILSGLTSAMVKPGDGIYGTALLPVKNPEYPSDVWSCRLIRDEVEVSSIRLEFLSQVAPIRELEIGAEFPFYRTPENIVAVRVVAKPGLHRP
jgi:hypothetical protein